MHRFEYNKRYAGVKKCASPACCNIHCCGNKFGVHSGRVKRNTRRYFRRATKNDWKREYELESTGYYGGTSWLPVKDEDSNIWMPDMINEDSDWIDDYACYLEKDSYDSDLGYYYGDEV